MDMFEMKRRSTLKDAMINLSECFDKGKYLDLREIERCFMNLMKIIIDLNETYLDNSVLKLSRCFVKNQIVDFIKIEQCVIDLMTAYTKHNE